MDALPGMPPARSRSNPAWKTARNLPPAENKYNGQKALRPDLVILLPQQSYLYIRINDQEGGGGFFREFYVASSVCEMGMLRVELEAVDE